jgi:predicted Zn-dependent protease
MGRRLAFLALAAIIGLGSSFSDRVFAVETEPTADPSLLQSPVAQSPVTRADLLRAADQALAGGRLVEAKELLDRLETEAAGPDGDSVKLLRAEWLIAVGRAVEAQPLLSAIEGSEPQQCRILSAEIIASLQLAELDHADRLVADHGPPCTEEPVFWRSLGRLHLVRERSAAAVTAFRNALALEPANDALRGDLGVALIAADEPVDAVHILADLLARNPDQPDVRINLDYANGMLGQRPARAALDNDMFWSRRLQYAGLGARRADRNVLAEALLGQALIERPRHDEELWRQYADISGNMAKGPGFVSN